VEVGARARKTARRRPGSTEAGTHQRECWREAKAGEPGGGGHKAAAYGGPRRPRHAGKGPSGPRAGSGAGVHTGMRGVRGAIAVRFAHVWVSWGPRVGGARGPCAAAAPAGCRRRRWAPCINGRRLWKGGTGSTRESKAAPGGRRARPGARVGQAAGARGSSVQCFNLQVLMGGPCVCLGEGAARAARRKGGPHN
jgi:hypothetical protein